MNYHYIQLEHRDQVAYLTLNRPDVHNAFDDRMIAELLHALDTVDTHSDCRAMVLKADGKNFSAGADLNWMRSMADKDFDENLDDAAELSLLMERLDTLSKPTIALVQGAAFGGAVGLAACCDVAIAHRTASFCLSEVKIGLIPAVISPYVMRAMGTRQARRYMLTAERFTAAVALETGLVHSIVDDLDSGLQAFLVAFKDNSPAAVTAAKRLALDIDQQPLNDATRRIAIERIAAIRVSAEGQEGLQAFLEKRTPAWKKG